MPLIKSPSKAAVGKNIRRELAANPGMKTSQAVAIALSTQRAAGGGKSAPVKRASGGSIPSPGLLAAGLPPRSMALAMDTAAANTAQRNQSERRRITGKPQPESAPSPPHLDARGIKRVPARDGMRKKLAARVSAGGAL